MEGVILFADDKIHDYSFNSTDSTFSQSDENKLYKELAESHPVLAVKTLDSAEITLKAIGCFNAVILDWQFDSRKKIVEEEDDETTKMIQAPSSSEDETFSFLMKNEIYSLIYIYSTAANEIKEKYGTQLEKKYPGRIYLVDKGDIKNTSKETKRILEEIRAWKEKNINISVPIFWSQSIIQSVQKIFAELNLADPNWITELHNTASKDGVNAEIEVVNLFQNILSEKIIQDDVLLERIKNAAGLGQSLTKPEDYAKLIRILYYGQSKNNDPVMTGDIFKLGMPSTYAIVITPECDVRHVAQNTGSDYFETLIFCKDDYRKGIFKLKASIKANPIITKAESFKTCKFSKNEKIEISQELNKQISEADKALQIDSFTQTNPRIHLLPCFQFSEEDNSGIAVLDFRSGLRLILADELKPENRIGKLNTPYIQELRQRFLSYKGRVGVPAYSKVLKEWLLLNK